MDPGSWCVEDSKDLQKWKMKMKINFFGICNTFLRYTSSHSFMNTFEIT